MTAAAVSVTFFFFINVFRFSSALGFPMTRSASVSVLTTDVIEFSNLSAQVELVLQTRGARD